MSNPNLERKLREIQRLKIEKYIGTKEAWNYLNRVTALYDNPEKVAIAINHNVRQELGMPSLFYEASREIVFGITDAIECCVA